MNKLGDKKLYFSDSSKRHFKSINSECKILSDLETIEFAQQFAKLYSENLENSSTLGEFCEGMIDIPVECYLDSNFYNIALDIYNIFDEQGNNVNKTDDKEQLLVYSPGIFIFTDDYDSAGDFYLISHYVKSEKNVIFDYNLFADELIKLGFKLHKKYSNDGFYSNMIIINPNLLFESEVNDEYRIWFQDYALKSKKVK